MRKPQEDHGKQYDRRAAQTQDGSSFGPTEGGLETGRSERDQENGKCEPESSNLPPHLENAPPDER